MVREGYSGPFCLGVTLGIWPETEGESGSGPPVGTDLSNLQRCPACEARVYNSPGAAIAGLHSDLQLQPLLE